MREDSNMAQTLKTQTDLAANYQMLDYRKRIWVTVDHAKLILSCGRTRIYELINEGHLTRVKNGHSTRITVESIQRFVSTIECGSPET